MTDIWSFLLQTATVSVVALLLLAVKWLLADKLSPRWQYGVWSLLALRILLPVDVTRQILLPIPLWMETLKAAVEHSLDSVYSGAYQPIGAAHPLPWITSAPESVTDWLLVVYAAGVIVWLLWCCISYFQLRMKLKQGSAASPAFCERFASLCAAQGLRPCRVVTVSGLPSAFVCGVISPVLVVPADTQVDDKVLLHELMHLKHHDALQNLFWCVLRALHWCNPFMHYVFDRIGNDMESLCDQRVLERLEGEERREYGAILLGMVSDRYARAPLTSSISNGSRNISRRISAIVRFKKYPKGMALVSVCIILVLFSPTIVGSANAISDQTYRPGPVSELDMAMAAVRLNRCTTVAGAIDAYAKGLLYENGVYIAAASPLSEHKALEEQMRRHVAEEGWVAYHLDSGVELEYIDRSKSYSIYDLIEHPDGSYSAQLTFAVTSFLNEDGVGLMQDENGDVVSGGVIIPVRISYSETDGWTVTETGARSLYIGRYDQMRYPDSALPWLRQYRAVGKSSTVTVSYRTMYYIDNEKGQSGTALAAALYVNDAFDETFNFDAEFYFAHTSYYVDYQHNFASPIGTPNDRVTVQAAHFSQGDDPDTIVFEPVTHTGNASGSSNQGTSWANMPVSEKWDGEIFIGSGGQDSDISSGATTLPYGCVIEVSWDGEAVERFTFSEEDIFYGT